MCRYVVFVAVRVVVPLAVAAMVTVVGVALLCDQLSGEYVFDCTCYHHPLVGL